MAFCSVVYVCFASVRFLPFGSSIYLFVAGWAGAGGGGAGMHVREHSHPPLPLDNIRYCAGAACELISSSVLLRPWRAPCVAAWCAVGVRTYACSMWWRQTRVASLAVPVSAFSRGAQASPAWVLKHMPEKSVLVTCGGGGGGGGGVRWLEHPRCCSSFLSADTAPRPVALASVGRLSACAAQHSQSYASLLPRPRPTHTNDSSQSSRTGLRNVIFLPLASIRSSLLWCRYDNPWGGKVPQRRV